MKKLQLYLTYYSNVNLCTPYYVLAIFPARNMCFSAWGLDCHSKFRFCGVRMGVNVPGTTVLKGKGKSDTSAIWRMETCDSAEAVYLMIFYSSLTFSAYVN